MLKDFENYVPNETHPLARDMNTAGQMVKILNNLSGPDVFVDGTGIHFRRPPIPDVPSLPVGELDGMVYQNTSQNTGGFADVRLVNRA
jgi:hypothetical protein